LGAAYSLETAGVIPLPGGLCGALWVNNAFFAFEERGEKDSKKIFNIFVIFA